MSTRQPTVLGRCDCGAEVRSDSFRDRDSYREYFLSGLCQSCQDRIFLAITGEPEPTPPIRRGAVAACKGGETAVVPFLFTRAGRPIAWEVRHIVRLGAALAPCDPWDALDPMRRVLERHLVRAHVADDASAPGVAERIGGLDLRIVADRCMLAALHALPPARSGVRDVVLENALPWPQHFGTPFAERLGVGPWDPSALRRCARLGAVLILELPGPGPRRTVLDVVLEAQEL